MRRPILGLGAALAIVLLMPAGQAFGQVGGLGGDPFSLYYGWYLPSTLNQASLPTPLDPINQQSARRQANVQAERSGLYDPLTPFGEDDLDPLSPYSSRRPTPLQQNTARTAYHDSMAGAARGNGSTMYYNRTARYYPGLKTGHGPNRNIAATRGRSAAAFGGAGGMPGIPSIPGMGGGMGMPAPR